MRTKKRSTPFLASRLALLVALLAVSSALACTPEGESGRDTVPPSHDVIVNGAVPARSTEGYDYIARRRHGVVALAEARGIPAATARDAVDHVADSLDSCVADRSLRAPPAAGADGTGAARVVAQVDPSGAVASANLRVDPGRGAAESAVLCLVLPVKLLAFPPIDAGARGFAIEALWGRIPNSP